MLEGRYDGKVSRTDGVCGFEESLLDDGIRDTGVLQNMLADIGVELEDIVLIRSSTGARTAALRWPFVRGAGRAAALCVLDLGHRSKFVVGFVGWREGRWETYFFDAACQKKYYR